LKILIADDEPASRRLLQATLIRWNFDVHTVSNGQEAWDCLQTSEAPPLIILDWLMPGIDGAEICRSARADARLRSIYIILLTSRGRTEDLVAGLQAGADDYVTKPFIPEELRARVEVGARVVQLQTALADRVGELEAALSREKHLQGLLPICCYCKKIRDDSNYWHQVDSYVSQFTEVRFTHSVCPECTDRFRKDLGVA